MIPFACREHEPAVGAESSAADGVFVRQRIVFGSGSPEAYGMVGAGGCDHGAIWAERYASHLIRMRLEPGDEGATLHLPDCRCVVCARGGDESAARAIGHLPYL